MAINLRKVKEHKFFVMPEKRKITEPTILESKINFNQKEFAQDMKMQMLDLEITKEDLSKLCYLTIDRVKAILGCYGKKVTEEEIKEIKRKLSLS